VQVAVRGLDKGERAALLISECQKAMTLSEFRDVRDNLARTVSERNVIPAITELAEGFRAVGRPVVHSHLVPRADWTGFDVHCALSGVLKRTDVLRADLPGSEPHPGLLPEQGDYWVRRPTGLTSFYGTEIDALLRANDVETVVITGVSTNVAVLGSTMEAVNRGYNVVVPTDCIAGAGEGHEYLLEAIYPLLATLTDRAAVLEVLSAEPGR
jgi:nicotinamidase-related amidase